MDFLFDMLEAREYGLQSSCFQILLVGIGNFIVFIDIIEPDKISSNGLSILRADYIRNTRCAFGFDFLSFEEVRSSLGGTLAERFSCLLLQISHECGITLIGYDRQFINVLNLFLSKFLKIHTDTVLVYANTKSTTDFLTFCNSGSCMAKRTDLEHIRIVPSLTESGVREDKSRRLFKA